MRRGHGPDAFCNPVDALQQGDDVFARHPRCRVTVWRQQVLDRVGVICDLSLFHDTRGALERVRQTQKTRHEIRSARASLQIEHALSKLRVLLGSLDAEVPEGICDHSSGGRLLRLHEAQEVLRDHCELRDGLKRLRACLVPFILPWGNALPFCLGLELAVTLEAARA